MLTMPISLQPIAFLERVPRRVYEMNSTSITDTLFPVLNAKFDAACVCLIDTFVTAVPGYLKGGKKIEEQWNNVAPTLRVER